MTLKGRGAQSFINNRFNSGQISYEHTEGIDEEHDLNKKTTFLEVYPKSIVNKVSSSDIPISYSMNPYQGCEHGCIYCYARNSHEYWGYNAALDFEQKILIKSNAAELLSTHFRKKNYQPETIMLSGNTDCYQPVERKKKITREILKTCLRFKHPVGIITKNSLIERDLDILSELAALNLVQVVITITTLQEELRRVLEPRTSTAEGRLKTVQKLHEAQVPVMVLMAPVIPALNSEEILTIAQKCAEAGAQQFGHQIVRLNGHLENLFYDWLKTHYSERADKVMNQIKEIHGGEVKDNRFGVRMKGEGVIAQQINDLFKIAKNTYFKNKRLPELRTDLFDPKIDDVQTRLEF